MSSEDSQNNPDSHATVNGNQLSPQRQLVSSPGLDALAAVASNIAPLVSPTQQALASNKDHEQSQLNLSSDATNKQTSGPNQSADVRSSSSQRLEMEKPLDWQVNGAFDGAGDQYTTNGPPKMQVKTELLEPSPNHNIPSCSPSPNTETPSGGFAPHLKQSSTPGTPLRNVTNTSPGPIPLTEALSLPPKKRRAPAKKGTAKPPASKKRKVEGDSASRSPSGARTGTPANLRNSNTPGPKGRKGQSATPTRSSSVLNGKEEENEEDDDDDIDDNELYCICRKPDDHSVMIGCDGPCEDWFHTRCVEMNPERMALVFKWYCKFSLVDLHVRNARLLADIQQVRNAPRRATRAFGGECAVSKVVSNQLGLTDQSSPNIAAMRTVSNLCEGNWATRPSRWQCPLRVGGKPERTPILWQMH